MKAKKYLLSKETADKKLHRMALEVAERNYDIPEIILIGIKENGLLIAQIVAEYLKEVFAGKIQVVPLSIDKKHPSVASIEETISINNKVVVLIDDVANSGRTMLYALQPLLNKHPQKIQTLALVERTHKSFPIDVDYIGLSVSTSLDQHIYVEVNEREITGAWMDIID
ncbi:MAG: phosphoribosyltransferase family protein [Ferruginibacter sp.]